MLLMNLFRKIAPLGMIVICMQPAWSQDLSIPPVTTADPGYLFPNDEIMRQTDPYLNPGSPANTQTPPPCDEAALNEYRIRTMEEHRKRLEPEYHMRVARDGQASADAWLKQTAFELGVRAGEAARACE